MKRSRKFLFSNYNAFKCLFYDTKVPKYLPCQHNEHNNKLLPTALHLANLSSRTSSSNIVSTFHSMISIGKNHCKVANSPSPDTSRLRFLMDLNRFFHSAMSTIYRCNKTKYNISRSDTELLFETHQLCFYNRF